MTKPWQRLSVEQYQQDTAKAMDEATWQAIVAQQAKARGWRVYHTHDSRRSAAGFPDLVLVRPPRVLFVELKRVGGKLTADQDAWLGELGVCSKVETHVWRPGDKYLGALK